MQELSAQQYVQDHRPRSWSRSTVADGRWMQEKTFTPLNGNDEQLGIFIDDLVKGLNTEETTRANADEAEAAARLAYDGVLSGRCDFLYTSATQIRNDLDQEVTDRKQNCNDASAHAYDLSKSYTDTASGNLDKRIDGVSGAFSSFRDTINNWRTTEVDPTLQQYGTDIGNLQNKTAQLSIDIKTSADKVREEFALADGVLQDQIDALTNATDVIDVVGTTAGLNPYTGFITSGDVIKVLSGAGGKQEYYKWTAAKSATSAPFSEFSLVGSLEPYYTMAQIDDKFTNYYNTTQIDDKLQYKVAVTAQNFTTAQQLQARTNIGASDGTIQWVGPNGTMNAPLKVVSAAGGIHIEDVHENELPTYKYFVAPEATSDDYTKFFGVYQGDKGPVASWLSPFPAKSSTDVGKALIVDTDVGLKWEDLGKGVHYVDLNQTTTATYDEVRAALEAGKQVYGYVSSDPGYNAFAVYVCQGWNSNRMAFINSHQGAIDEKKKKKNTADISFAYNEYLITGQQSLSTTEEAQVRANIDAAKKPLIILISSGSTMSTTDFNKLESAIAAGELVRLKTANPGGGEVYYDFSALTSGSYEFKAFVDGRILYYALVNKISREVTINTVFIIQDSLPTVFTEGTIYVV